MQSREVFVTGGTGYIGSRLLPMLVTRGHSVTALARAQSAAKLPPGLKPAIGDVLTPSYSDVVRGCETFVHLVGVSHPSPAKAAEFRSIDLAALRAAVQVAGAAKIRHFVFISVAHPAPVMKAYIEVRQECEQIIRQSGINATILRPWYVLGPGHRWPFVLSPIYRLLELIPETRESALRLGLVTVDQILAGLVKAVENPAEGIQILGVPEIRQSQLGAAAGA
jgi:uncharacterized protein YbjT (DUF2867 family)